MADKPMKIAVNPDSARLCGTDDKNVGRTPMAEFGWDHVHIKSFDVAGAARWFQDQLGAKPVPGTEIGEARADLMIGGARLLVTQVKAGDGTNPTPPIPYAGFEHFGLTVRDIDKVAAELKARGVEFTRDPVTPRPGLRICFIRSPQGISIELLERDAKYK
jgi:catechol 2,3-dioxygenase-like lactoylglutathione lyase family enzyme